MLQLPAASVLENSCPAVFRAVLPVVLSHNSLEYFLHQFDQINETKTQEIEIDAGALTVVSSYGVLSLIILTKFLESKHYRIKFRFGSNRSMALSLDSWNFFNQCPRVDCDIFFSGHTDNQEVFLPAVEIAQTQDVYAVIAYLREHLAISVAQLSQIAVAVSEISQNILEHSQAQGYICMAKVNDRIWQKNILQISVADSGVGMGQSLKEKISSCDESLRDSMAIYKTLYEGLSRHSDLGRGNGIIKTRQLVEKFGGKMMVRSGTSKLWGNIPVWEIERFMRKQLCFLPGTQIHFTFSI